MQFWFSLCPILIGTCAFCVIILSFLLLHFQRSKILIGILLGSLAGSLCVSYFTVILQQLLNYVLSSLGRVDYYKHNAMYSRKLHLLLKLQDYSNQYYLAHLSGNLQVSAIIITHLITPLKLELNIHTSLQQSCNILYSIILRSLEQLKAKNIIQHMQC